MIEILVSHTSSVAHEAADLNDRRLILEDEASGTSGLRQSPSIPAIVDAMTSELHPTTNLGRRTTSRLDVAVPARARELSGLDHIDYADAWAIDVARQRSPREWLQIALAGNPALFAAIRVAHRGLGLQLAPAGDSEHPVGRRILRDNANECVLAANGLLGDARIVGIATPTKLTFATLLDLNGVLGAVLWYGAGVRGHRTLGPMILGRVSNQL